MGAPISSKDCGDTSPATFDCTNNNRVNEMDRQNLEKMISLSGIIDIKTQEGIEIRLNKKLIGTYYWDADRNCISCVYPAGGEYSMGSRNKPEDLDMVVYEEKVRVLRNQIHEYY